MPEDDSVDTNRFIIRVEYPVRGRDLYFPKEVFWIYRKPDQPLPTLCDLEALILLQKILRFKGFSRVIVRLIDSEAEAGLRAHINTRARPLESFMTDSP